MINKYMIYKQFIYTKTNLSKKRVCIIYLLLLFLVRILFFQFIVEVEIKSLFHH